MIIFALLFVLYFAIRIYISRLAVPEPPIVTGAVLQQFYKLDAPSRHALSQSVILNAGARKHFDRACAGLDSIVRASDFQIALTFMDDETFSELRVALIVATYNAALAPAVVPLAVAAPVDVLVADVLLPESAPALVAATV